jgi:hydrogenase maturation protein HypF
LKNTFCATKDEYAFLSQHIGDMENLETLEHFETSIELYKRLFRLELEIIAYDMHPEYLATKYALELEEPLKLVPVQHHHAHIVGCMVDNGIQGEVIGVALDGTGYGSDGHIWGGEFLVANYRGFRRMGHLQYVPLPGGEAAILSPYRMAIGHLYALLGDKGLNDALPFLGEVNELEVKIIKQQIEKGINTPLTSSCGRFFDAVSALLGFRGQATYEAQAAIDLEMIAGGEDHGTSYPFSILERDGLRIIQVSDVWRGILDDLRAQRPTSAIALKFHNTIGNMIGDMCGRIAMETGLNRVALSGGCFQNRLLLTKAVDILHDAGFEVFTHAQAPCNDGGVSLGQATIANFMCKP